MSQQIDKEVQRKISKLQQVVKSKVDEYLKNVERVPLKYTKVSVNPSSDQRWVLHIKIYLLRPIRLTTLNELVKIINQFVKSSEWYVFAPHSNAIRISTEFSISQISFKS